MLSIDLDGNDMMEHILGGVKLPLELSAICGSVDQDNPTRQATSKNPGTRIWER